MIYLKPNKYVRIVDGEPVIAFGQYADEPLDEVPRAYLVWMQECVDLPDDVAELIEDLLIGEYDLSL